MAGEHVRSKGIRLRQLTDVRSEVVPGDGSVLTYNAGNGKWEPRESTPAGPSVSSLDFSSISLVGVDTLGANAVDLGTVSNIASGMYALWFDVTAKWDDWTSDIGSFQCAFLVDDVNRGAYSISPSSATGLMMLQYIWTVSIPDTQSTLKLQMLLHSGGSSINGTATVRNKRLGMLRLGDHVPYPPIPPPA